MRLPTTASSSSEWETSEGSSCLLCLLYQSYPENNERVQSESVLKTYLSQSFPLYTLRLTRWDWTSWISQPNSQYGCTARPQNLNWTIYWKLAFPFRHRISCYASLGRLILVTAPLNLALNPSHLCPKIESNVTIKRPMTSYFHPTPANLTKSDKLRLLPLLIQTKIHCTRL